MKYRCSHCSKTFESTKAPKECPLCRGQGKVRTKMPTKLTNKQRRQIAALDPALVKAFREAQAVGTTGQVVVKVVPEAKPAGLIEASCTIKLV